jgi:hypothetical protein
VLNAGGEPRDVRVTVAGESSDSRAPARPASQGQAPVTVAANQSADVTLPVPSAEAARVSVEDPRGVPGDNSRFVVLKDASRPTVAVGTATGDLAREAFYIRQALSVGDEARRVAVEGVGVAQLASRDAAGMRRFSAVVLPWTRGIERHARERLAEFVKQGGAVLVTAGPGMDADVIADIVAGVRFGAAEEAGDGRSMTVEDVRHPIFQTFGGNVSGLGLVRFTRAAEIVAPDCHTIARFTTGRAALVDCAPGEGRVLVFASDLDNKWNDFPLHPSFVPFLHEALRYLTGSRQPSSEYLVADAPAGVPREPGIVHIPTAGGGSRLAAINVDPRESDPRRLSGEEFQAAVTRSREPAGMTATTELRGDEDRQHIWQYLLLGMAFVLVAESLVARRAI